MRKLLLMLCAGTMLTVSGMATSSAQADWGDRLERQVRRGYRQMRRNYRRGYRYGRGWRYGRNYYGYRYRRPYYGYGGYGWYGGYGYYGPRSGFYIRF